MKAKRRAKIEFFQEIQKRCVVDCVWNYDNGTNWYCNNEFICINRGLYLNEKEYELDNDLNPIEMEGKTK